MHRRWLLVWPLVLTAVLVACQPGHDDTMVVDSFADDVDADPGDGTCAAANGSCTLRAAVMEANAAEGINRIVLPAGTYPLDRSGAGEDTGATGDLDVTGSTYIDASGGVATIDGAGLGDRLIDIHSGGWHRLDGIRLINGDVTGEGGALRIRSGILLGRVDITGNQASVAGGGIAGDAVVSIEGSSITTNAAPVGGGISNARILMVDNSTISANNGGGVQATGGTTRLRFSTVTDNTGGGLTGQTGTIELMGSVVAHQNNGTDCTGPAASSDHNVDSDGSCGLDQPADKPASTVAFGPLHTPSGQFFPAHEALGVSPLHNGVPPGVHECGDGIVVDQFGRFRPAGAGCDIGAVESIQLVQQAFCSFNGIVHAATPSAGGGYYVGGEFSRISDDSGTDVVRQGLARCGADGLVATGFDPDLGKNVFAVVVNGNWLYAGGSFDVTRSGTRYRGVARVDLGTGDLDPTWNPNVNGSVRTLAVDASGVYVGGNVTHVDDQPVSRLVKLDISTGDHITTFAVTVDHSIAWENVLSLHQHTSGDLFVGGTFDTINGVARASVARIDATDGTVQPFDPTLTDTNPNDPKVQIESVVEHNGSIYLCGDWWETEGVGSENDQRNVGRFDPVTGAADLGWLPSISRGLQACSVDALGTGLIVAGDHDEVNGATVGAVQTLDLTTGTVDPSWLPDPTTSVGVKMVTVTPAAVLLGGDISASSGTSVGNTTLYVSE